MKLLKIETKGFKSFANKITLNFDGGIAGVVGPNGSGKSNINDAIKWVLGEQSIKSLRGDSSDDVIFSGSKLETASNQAEVSLTFDNSQKRISLPHEKITITRILKRGEGSNLYYINGDNARLKDIKEIAMESGIGKSSLAIISQGTISDIAEATPEQRRGIFEEAAGISKYKTRKKEAMRKLESTAESLDKIKTIIYELEKQLNPLKRQAEKAKKYLKVREEMQDIEISVIVKDIDFFSDKLEKLNIELESVLDSKESLNKNIEELENSIEEKSSYKLKVENEILSLSNKFEEINKKLNQIELNETRVSERRKLIIEGAMNSTSNEKIKAMKEELDTLASKVKQYNQWEINALDDISQKRLNVANVQKEISKYNFEFQNKSQRIIKIAAKMAILQDHDQNKSNLFKGVKTIIENKTLFPGYIGLVSELITIPQEYKKAIETILAYAMQHIVVQNSDVAVKAVNFLKTNRSGRATFIPLQSIKPKGLVSEHEMIISNMHGYVGRASELITTSIENQTLAKFLLGHIIVADSIDDATQISKTLNHKYMVVSLDGDIIRSGGVITGGEANKSMDLVGIKDQIKQLKDILPKLENEKREFGKKASELSIVISEEQAIIGELNIEIARVKEKKDIAQNQFSNLKSTYESTSKQKFAVDEANALESQETLINEKTSIETLLKAKRDSIININNSLSQFTIQKTEFERTLRELIDSSSTKMTEKAQGEFILNNAKTRLAEEYEMTIDAARELAKEIKNIEQAREIIAKLKQEIKEIGHVNLDSIELFDEVNERHNKLKSSEEELFSAKQTIISAIDEMDQIIITKLDETINDINKEFANVFTNMFGGGIAEIKYTNPNNLLETGIDVLAQPPGKTVKNLKLFSGGEKALIAISLLFSILKSKPLPLCILDEVEAALDEANVVRFADYLQKLKQQTQFIVITHRVGTMSRVDVLFGATMQNRGVTSFFAVKLEEAKKLLNDEKN